MDLIGLAEGRHFVYPANEMNVFAKRFVGLHEIVVASGRLIFREGIQAKTGLISNSNYSPGAAGADPNDTRAEHGKVSEYHLPNLGALASSRHGIVRTAPGGPRKEDSEAGVRGPETLDFDDL